MQKDNGCPSTSTADKKSSTSDKSTQTVSRRSRRVVFGTWNVRSLQGKVAKIILEIEKVDADVVVLTETKKKIITKHPNTGAKSKKLDLSSGTKSKTSDSCSGTKSETSDSSSGTESETSDSSSGAKSKRSDSNTGTKSKMSDSSPGTKSKTSDSSTRTKRNENTGDSFTEAERNESTEDSTNPNKEYFGDYTHIYTGVRQGRAQAGVSIIFKTYSCLLYDWEAVSDRIITAKMSIGGQKFIIIGVYGLSENASSDIKYDFNAQFANELIKASSLREENYELVILGDFNSKVGISTSSAVGEFGVDEMSENGCRLLEICDNFDLKIQNTFFEHEDVHKYTRYAKPSLIDFFITENDTNLKVHDVMACKWLECETDHVFVKAVVSIPTEEDKKKAKSETTDKKEKSKDKISLSQLEILEMLFDSKRE